MKIVNRYGTPQVFVDADKAISASYDKGEDVYLSATGIIAPPQIRILRELYDDEIEVDITDRLYMLEGSIAHNMLEAAVYGDPMATLKELRRLAKLGKKDVRKYIHIIKDFFFKNKNLVVEDRLFGYVDVPNYGRVKISGKIDLREFKDGQYIIEDYKRTSVWTVIHGLKKEWDQQGNIYAWLLRENGYSPVARASFVGWIRDWSRRKAAHERDYPPTQTVVMDAELRDHEWVTRWLQSRLKVHLDADRGIEIPECTTEERWASEDKFAVKKEGNKRATKLLDSEEEAYLWISENGKEDAKYVVERRVGESIRCKYYCEVAGYCSQFKRIQQEEEEQNNGTS